MIQTTTTTGGSEFLYVHMETLSESYWRMSNEHAECAERCVMLDDLRGFDLHAEMADLCALVASAAEHFELALNTWPRANALPPSVLFS